MHKGWRRVSLYDTLLREWCDALLRLQITERSEPEFYGGILCPACARIHGRCGDAIYPFMYLADTTGEKKYLNAARRLFTWTEHNMARKNGSLDNDTNSTWKGTTVFYVMQLAEALLHHGGLLEPEERAVWTERLKKSSAYLTDNIDVIGGNINYPITCAYALGAAAKALGKEGTGSIRGQSEKADELARRALGHMTENSLLYGEGKDTEQISNKGCRPIDIGYNVEESLPALAMYARLKNDREVLERVKHCMRAHMEFMLPDGAWDNSWGTRNNKWTYWGSRTSDGCLAGYGIFADEDPQFAEAVYRNAELLRKCTYDGLLYGGPMFREAGELPCVHHTFCHAKSIASMLDMGIRPEKQNVQLPREQQAACRCFPDAHVNLIRAGGFLATVTDYDIIYSRGGHATGGAITVLWHGKTGPIVAGSMTEYALVEYNNMQPLRKNVLACMTPRLEYSFSGTEMQRNSKAGSEGKMYRSINDTDAVVTVKERAHECMVQVQGVMKDLDQHAGIPFFLSYCFAENKVRFRGTAAAEGTRMYFPCIVSKKDRVKILTENMIHIEKENAVLQICSDRKILGITEEERIFNPVGGFIAQPIYIAAGENTAEITIEVL